MEVKELYVKALLPIVAKAGASKEVSGLIPKAPPPMLVSPGAVKVVNKLPPKALLPMIVKVFDAFIVLRRDYLQKHQHLSPAGNPAPPISYGKSTNIRIASGVAGDCSRRWAKSLAGVITISGSPW